MWYAKGSSVLPASGGALRPSMPSPISSAPWMAHRPTSLPARRSICETWVMAKNVLVDAGFVVALLSSRDNHHEWAVTQASELPPPWSTCEAVLSESFHLLRSEEHTSELQSRENLVCRLLLEKKKSGARDLVTPLSS